MAGSSYQKKTDLQRVHGCEIALNKHGIVALTSAYPFRAVQKKMQPFSSVAFSFFPRQLGVYG